MAFNEYLIDKRQRVIWIAETSYGTGGNLASALIPGLDCKVEPDFNQNWTDVLTAGADNRYVQNRIPGPLAYPFKLSFDVTDWRFLKYCGYGVTDGGSVGAYTHTFAIANTIQSFKMEWALRHTTSVVFTVTGCVVKNCILNFSKASGSGTEGKIRATLDCVAQAVSIGSSVQGSISSITASPFQWRTFKLTVNTAEITEVNNGEITIDQNIDEEDSRYCNSTLDRAIGEPIPKIHTILGRTNITLKDATFFTLWAAAVAVGGTNKFEFIRGTNDNLAMTFTNLRIHKAFPPTDFEGPTKADLPFSVESFTSLIATDAIATY